MTSTKRLMRLARAQEDLTRVLEIRHAEHQAEIQRLRQAEDELSRSLNTGGADILAAGTSGLQRLARTTGALHRAEEESRQMTDQLRMARGKRDRLVKRLAVMEVERDRQQQQAEGLEAAVALLGKASRKPNVLK